MESLSNPEHLEKLALLWSIVIERHDIIELLALCDTIEIGEEETWKQRMFAIIQESMCDDRIATSLEAYEQTEQAVDGMMSMLNLGTSVAPKMVYLVIKICVHVLQKMMENEWAIKDTSNDDFNSYMNSTLHPAMLIVTRSAPQYLGKDLPIIVAEINPEDFKEEDRVDMVVVKELMDYLETAGIVKIGDPTQISNPITKMMAMLGIDFTKIMQNIGNDEEPDLSGFQALMNIPEGG